MNIGKIIVEKLGHIAVLTWNDPATLNAMNEKTVGDVNKGLDSIEKDREIYVMIFTGTGRSFISGGDIKEMVNVSAVEALNWLELTSGLARRLEEFSVPVIGAVNGFALGGGTEIAMGCDLLLASDKAKFGLPEVGLGVVPGAGGTQRLPRLIGISKAKELIYTGRIIDAHEAESIGLVNKVVPHDSLREESLIMAGQIARQAPIAIRQCKLAVNTGMQTDLLSGLNFERQASSMTFGTEDKKIGMTAFINKKKEKTFINR